MGVGNKLDSKLSIKPAWKFNSLFEQYTTEEAVKKASEMEVQRAQWSQLPLLEEIYKPGWKAWKDLPGGPLVQELMDYFEAEKRANQHEPWYSVPNKCELIMKGEMGLEEFKNLQATQYAMIDQGVSLTAFASANAYMRRDKDLKQLAVWWQFEEETHEEMLEKLCVDYLGIQREDLYKISANFTSELLKLPPAKEVNSDNIASLTRLQAIRAGPPVLLGATILMEIENPWRSQEQVRAIRKYYDLPNDAMPFFNVHTFVDYFHIRIGQYILAKYATTNELRDLCRRFFIVQREAQMQRSKNWYGLLQKGSFAVRLSANDNKGF